MKGKYDNLEWERVCKSSDTTDGVGPYTRRVIRLKVEGGWLYQSIAHHGALYFPDQMRIAESICFVPEDDTGPRERLVEVTTMEDHANGKRVYLTDVGKVHTEPEDE